LTLVLTVIAFGLMILIHECGHFFVARAFGVRIETFSIGFGKPIINFNRGGTNYRISWLPLGGYIKMKGENPDDPDTTEEDAFQSRAWWQRACIALAGPLANLVLALIVFIFALMLPQKVEDNAPVISQAQGKWAGIFMPGDSLISVNNSKLRGFSDLFTKLEPGKDNQLVLSRNGKNQTLRLRGGERESLAEELKPVVEPVVGDVTPGYPAWRSGIRTRDRVLSVDSVRVADWYDMRERITGSKKQSVILTIQRGDSLLTKVITLESNVLDGKQKIIGITQYMPVRYTEQLSPLKAIRGGGITTLNMVIMNYYGLYKLIQRPSTLKSNIGGPVMIVSMSQSVGQKGLAALLMFFGGISILLMIMNLLPIPVLDGGHIFFCLIEGIIRKPIPLKVQEIAQRIGFFLLMMLMIYAFYADIQKLILRFIHS